MTIKATEVGKLFNYSTGFDLSGNTELELKFTSPAGTETSLTKTGGRVSAPAVTITDSDLGTIPASTYMQITTNATDFTEDGSTWNVCCIYTDATPKVFHGDDAGFTVEEAC